MQTTKKDAILIKYPQKLTFGLTTGSSDLVGWEYIIIAENQGNIQLPVFCSIEVKTKSSPKIEDDQIRWLNNVINIGGQAYLAEEQGDSYILRAWMVINK